MNTEKYYALHCHSEYSYKDALSSPEDIAKRNKELGNNAFCITDHGNVNCWIKAWKAAEKYEIQFIPGLEIYLLPEREFWSLDSKNREKDGEIISPFATKYHHLTLIAKNQTGVESLIKIYNRKEMHYGKECISRDILFNNSEGLIVLSGCVVGEAIFYIQNGMVDKAEEILKLYKNKYGDDFYVEIQYHGLISTKIPEKDIYNTLVSLAKKLNIEMVPTTDSHYTYPEQKDYHSIYKAIHYGNFQYDYNGDGFKNAGFEGDGYHIASYEEIKEKIKNIDSLSEEEIEHIISNTVKIKNQCEKTHFPEALPLVDKSKELRELVEKGFREYREGTEYENESRERIDFELATMERMGFTEYFINVYNIVNRARRLNILPGPGRGSAAGSEVCFLLGITKIDPLRYNLMFERFLNPARFNYPDIDLDIQSDKNGELGKQILIDSLSHDLFPFTGQILNEMRATIVVLFKQLAKVFGIDYYLVIKVTTDPESAEKYLLEKEYTGWLPSQLEKLGISFTPEWREFEKYIDFCYKYGDIPYHEGHEPTGVIWNTSIHASGVIFYPSNNLDILPKNDSGIPYRGHDLEDVGFIKYDILSIDALNPIGYFMDRIEKDTGKKFDWMDTNDPEAWKIFQEAKTDFVFQFSSAGMKRLLKHIKPDNIDVLAELNSLYRPGAIAAGILDRYIKDEYTDDELVVGAFMKEEFGEQHSNAMIFQEDIMKIVQKMAGFTLTDADLVRRAMQRKEKERLLGYKKQFIEGFDNEKYGDIAETVWDKIEKFAAYTFNKSHSVAYGTIAYWQAYIYAHYKNDFLKYLLDKGKDKQKVLKILSEDRNIIYPTLTTKNEEYIVDNDAVYLPTVYKNEDNESFSHYLLNLNPEKNKMIVKYGIFDDICIDRKALRSLGKAIPKKVKDSLTDTQIEGLNSNNIKEFINNLSALGILDYEEGNGYIKVLVHKARSDEEIIIHTRLNKEMLFQNAQEDIRAFGLVRKKYASASPEIPFDDIVERVENIAMSDENANRNYILEKMSNTHPVLQKIRNEEYIVVCHNINMKNNFMICDFVFNNDILSLGIKNKNASALIKRLGKNCNLIVKLDPKFYINKDNEIDYRINVVYAEEKYKDD